MLAHNPRISSNQPQTEGKTAHPFSSFQLWSESFASFEEYAAARERDQAKFQARRMVEDELQHLIVESGEATLPGYCWTCRDIRGLTFDRRYSNGEQVNWRERLVCPTCQLNNRLRLSIQIFERMTVKAEPDVYITEQVTPLAEYLKGSTAALIASEYLGPAFRPGQHDSRGIRHEDVTSLSMADNAFDYCLSFDVLEHVPNYRAALRELHRVLRPTGCLMLSAPFVVLAKENILRARIRDDGEIEHLLPPEYHGDPVDPGNGVLCYHHFGWSLLKDLRDAGFKKSYLSIFWSLPFGHIGDEQVLIFAEK